MLTGQVTTATEKKVCGIYSQNPREGGTPCHGGGAQRGHIGSVEEAEESREVHGRNLYCGFCGKEQEWQGKEV